MGIVCLQSNVKRPITLRMQCSALKHLDEKNFTLKSPVLHQWQMYLWSKNVLLLCYYSMIHSSKSKKVDGYDFMAREQIIHWIQLLGQGMGQVWALKNFPDEKGDPKNLEKNYRRK